MPKINHWAQKNVAQFQIHLGSKSIPFLCGGSSSACPSTPLSTRISAPEFIAVSITLRLTLISFVFQIATAMGITWTLGFIAAITNFEALWWIFVIINSLQGVFLLVGFGLSTRVRQLFKERYFPVKRPNDDNGPIKLKVLQKYQTCRRI